jgi:hypothetical protein
MRVVNILGIQVSLNKKDKQEIERTGKLEASLYDNPKCSFVLHLVDEVKGRETLEEPGFHIEAFPPDSPKEERKSYDVYLSKERFRSLITPPLHKTELGYFCSRSRFDRVEFTYFNG